MSVQALERDLAVADAQAATSSCCCAAAVPTCHECPASLHFRLHRTRARVRCQIMRRVQSQTEGGGARAIVVIGRTLVVGARSFGMQRGMRWTLDVGLKSITPEPRTRKRNTDSEALGTVRAVREAW